MPTATAQRIRPGRAVHREWLAALDADSKATVKANVESMIAEGTSQAEAWDRVYDSSQQPPAVSPEVEQAIDDAAAATVDKAVEPEQEQAVDAPKGSRSIATKAGKLPGHLRTALSSLKSDVADDGTLTIVRGEQQQVVKWLRGYLDADELPDHVRWTFESVIGKVRAMFHKTADDGDNVNVRAIDAMIRKDVQFEVVMRSDGSPTYKVGDVVMSARDALKAHSDEG